MNEHTRSITTENQHGVAIADLLSGPAPLTGMVMVAAMVEPKLPPLVGD